MKDYKKFSDSFMRCLHKLGTPDYVMLRTGDGHWMALAGSVLVLPTARMYRLPNHVASSLWCIIGDIRYRHPKYSWDFMDILSPYVGGRWVNFEWYK